MATTTSQLPAPSTSNNTTSNVQPDYRLLLAWSYYLASQAAWLSPMFQQQGHAMPSLSTDPQMAAKLLQEAMQMASTTRRNPSMGMSPRRLDNEQITNDVEPKINDNMFMSIKKEADQP
jgi:hypothetical protein